MIQKIDITGEHCPMTFVKTKLALAKLSDGDVLEVTLSEGEPLQNVPRSAEEQGFKVLSVKHIDGTKHLVTIQK